MYTNLLAHSPKQSPLHAYDSAFFEDMLELFLGTNAGHVGKHIYGSHIQVAGEGETIEDMNWKRVVSDDNRSFYLPDLDKKLLEDSQAYIRDTLPQQTPLVDFGVGEMSAFQQHIVPLLTVLQCPFYYGVDYCRSHLDALKQVEGVFPHTRIVPVQADFFDPDSKVISASPALGVMLCSTIGNLDGTLRDIGVSANLTRALRLLSRQTNHGWLLLSVDTTQTETRLLKGYATATVAQFVLTAFDRMSSELPTKHFDPSLFTYAPEWHSDLQLLAHIAVATKSQDFQLGPHMIQIKQGQKYHLLNSYKFGRSFFERCCDKARLDILKTWKRGQMLLYLLEDRARKTTKPCSQLS